MLKLDGSPVSFNSFVEAVANVKSLIVSAGINQKIEKARKTVDKLAAGKEPVYGLNTGLGANLNYRLKPEEIPEFQMQLVRGRAVACGEPLPEEFGRAALLARIISATVGYSGISAELFAHLCKVYEAGFAPAIPEYGSISAGDLTQNASMALCLLGDGEFWKDGKLVKAGEVLSSMELPPPELQPKDAMVLVNHSGVSVARAAAAIHRSRIAFVMMKHATVLSIEGYGANTNIFDEALNSLRPAPGQAECAAWFRQQLQGAETNPRRIQEALSFRTAAPVMGAAGHALNAAIGIWQEEANGSSDSPVVLSDGSMHSTPNFHAPVLALALEQASLSLAMVANGSLQRMQKLMNPELSGLPKYLSPVGGGSAGMVPAQKTAAALLAEIRHKALPVAYDAAPVSDTIEDMATMTIQAAAKLEEQTKPLRLLAGLEALVACQALDLREPAQNGKLTSELWPEIRKNCDTLRDDRALGSDIDRAATCLEEAVIGSIRENI